MRRACLLVSVAFCGCLTALTLAEGGLRLWGFRFASLPTVQFGWPDPIILRDNYVPDKDLLWVTQDYADKLGKARQNPPSVIFMGDSCTEFGNYPALTLESLAIKAPALSSGLSLGVAGWSSQQGRWQLERDVVPLHPKVVTIYFGWNDHWVALGKEDKDSQPSPFSFAVAKNLRLAQLLNRLRAGRDLRMNTRRQSRVSLADYRSNLIAMIRDLRAGGVVPILITAAANHERGKEPARIGMRFLRDITQLVPLHRSYVDMTRKVAAETGAALCDVSSKWEADPERPAYFIRDGIHLTDEGNRKLAALLVACIKEAYHPEESSPGKS